MEGAVLIGGAFGALAGDQRIAAEAVQAVASRMVIVVGAADGVAAALDLLAGVDAVAVDARLAGRAIVIGSTSDWRTEKKQAKMYVSSGYFQFLSIFVFERNFQFRKNLRFRKNFRSQNFFGFRTNLRFLFYRVFR